MPRYRIEFMKGDPVRFLSHLDLVKAFERSIRRAAIPIAFSEGFNPHPKMNFASALAVGVVSEGEYIDIDLREDLEPDELFDRLSKAMPPGIGLKRAWPVPDRTPALMAVVNRAAYQITAQCQRSVKSEELQQFLKDFLELKEIMITKRTKKGFGQKDIRPGIIDFSGKLTSDGVEFDLVAAMGSSDTNVRPEEAVTAFVRHSGLPIDLDSMYIKRQALLIEKDGKMVSPPDFQVQ